MTSIVPPLESPSRRDRLIATSYKAANLATMGRMAARRGPRAMVGEFQRFPWLKTLFRVNELHENMTIGRSGAYREANAFLIHNVTESIVTMLEGVYYRPEINVLHEDLVPPEILFAMGLHPWMAEFLGILLPMIDSTLVEQYIDVAESDGFPPDVCSLPKATTGMVLDGVMPPPVALVASNMPCDGGMSQYTVIERHFDIPAFRLDVPYDFQSDRAVDYFVDELKRLITWLEEHTPGRMDWDRLREVCRRRNQIMEMELDLWDLMRHKPAPMAAEAFYLAHMVYTIARPGTKRGVRVMKKILGLARKNLRAGRGALADERYRVALWNPPTMVCLDLFAWAERVYGTALVMDMLSYHNHPFIDTRTPESMLRGLAQVLMQGPMAQHTRGPASNFFDDLFRIREQFDVDMIWMAGHIGCKNTQALMGMFRELCRKRDVPLLVIDYDLNDARIVSPAGVRGQVVQFMDTVMRAEQLVRPTGLEA